MEDTNTKPLLPVHLILGVAEYSKIKTSEPQQTGSVGDPVAEYTQFGWTITSPGAETNLDKMFLAQKAQPDYGELCRMDLGLQDTSVGDQNVVHEEFLEQLKRDPKEGWYESSLPWKGDHPPLPSNEANGCLKRLGTLVQRLKKT